MLMFLLKTSHKEHVELSLESRKKALPEWEKCFSNFSENIWEVEILLTISKCIPSQ
jgi:hypothetical protein